MRWSLLILIFFFSFSAHASDLLSLPNQGQLIANGQTPGGQLIADGRIPSGQLIAQQDDYDAYDPFADYSEFDEASDEESDIYFFKNGRFFTIGIIGGYESFTSNLGQIYQGAPDFGLLLAYFFDLRFAVQFSFTTSQHSFDFTAGSQEYSGSLGLNSLSFDLKYYLNVQNVTKGLADFNPYLLVGFTQISRELNINSSAGASKDSALGFRGGVGAEFPMMKNKIHLGLEAIYEYVNFPGEGSPLPITGVTIKPSGDVILMQAIIGFNF